MHSRLSHIVAVSKRAKSDATTTLTQAHHKLQRTELTKGLSRTYQPLNDEGIGKPPESTKVQVSAIEIIESIKKDLIRLFDITYTQDNGNVLAKADVKVDGQVLVQGATVPFLLFLEKQLTDIGTFVNKLPVLEPSENWTYDPTTGHFKTDPVKTLSTVKKPRNHEKAPATDKHPAQVDVYFEDVPVGEWSAVKFSGALPATQVKTLSEKVRKLQDAVKVAREEANATEIPNMTVGAAVLGYLFDN